MRTFFCSLFLGSLLLVTLQAEAGIWGERGISRRFIVEGERLYAADGRGVAVYDIGNPSDLSRIHVERGDDETLDLALVGTSDLIAGTVRGVERFAVAADGSLMRRGSLALGGPAVRVAGGEHYAAAAVGSTAFILTRTGSTFEIVRQISMNNPIVALAFVDDYLYVSVDREATYVYAAATGSQVAVVAGADDFALEGTTLWIVAAQRGLLAVDVSDAGSPKNLPLPLETPLGLVQVAAAGSRLYALVPPDRVHVFNVSSVTAPVLLTTLEGWAEVIAARGQHLFLSGGALDAETLRYESGVPLRALNMTVPSDPQVADEVQDYAGPVSGVWTDGSIAYVVDPPYFRVLDVSTTASPREITSIALPPDAQERVRVKNGMAIVYGRGLVHLVDVSRPLAPVYAGTWHAQGHPPSDAAPLAENTFVEANMHSGLHVVDHTNPAAAHQVGGRIWHYHAIAAGDDAIYVLQASQFLALKVANRTTVIDSWQLSLRAAQIEISPPAEATPRFVVTRGLEGLHLFALEDRFTPRLAMHYPEIMPERIGTGDGVVWLAIDGSLQSLDLEAPSSPVDSGHRVTSPQQISVAGEKVVVADRYSVRVYGPDTAPPDEPRMRRRAVGR
ncbi:MAG TPA: hypothetical protein VF701_01080 [Thermoanaerobaculia bacterium]